MNYRIATLLFMLSFNISANVHMEGNTSDQSAACGITDDVAEQGAFAVGYTATFETQPNGTSVKFTFELLDTDKVGVVGFLWRQTPFQEFSMTDLGDNVFSTTIDGLTNGQTISYACKFAFAGGLAVTKYIEYVVGEVCNADPLTDATLSDIQVDGMPIEGFSSSQLSYQYEAELPVPMVTATTTQTGAEAVVSPANAIPGTTTILVTAEDKITTKTYTIEFVEPTNYLLVWSDEFDEDGAINADKWFHQTQIPQGSSWFNNEVQHYTNRTDNSVVEEGVLKIIGKSEPGYTQDGVSKNYTSARLNSKFAFTYGKVDIRAKLPPELGTWPALWMLGKNISEPGAYWQTQGFGTTPWPITGEIDIMEQFGRNVSEKNDVHGSTHTPKSSGATENTSRTALNTSTTEFHVYSIIWDANEIQFLVDDEEYYTYNPTFRYGSKVTDPANADMNWPFDEPQYLILNIAMGGTLGGTIPTSFTEGVMEVDYVRVFQIGEPSLSVESLSVTLDENSPNGTVVGEVSATYVGNGTLNYSITNGNEDEVFEIGETNGEITVADNSLLDFATTPSYTLTVAVSDDDLVETATITIQVNEIMILGFDGSQLGAFKAYPNPVISSLTLSSREMENLKLVNVTDISGKEITIPLVKTPSSYKLDFSAQRSGIYILRLKNEDGLQSIRVRKL